MLCFIKLRHNSLLHHKFHPFKMYSLVSFTRLYSHYHCLIPKTFSSFFKRNSIEFLAVLWLGLRTFTAKGLVQSPIGDLRCTKLLGLAKRKKETPLSIRRPSPLLPSFSACQPPMHLLPLGAACSGLSVTRCACSPAGMCQSEVP